MSWYMRSVADAGTHRGHCSIVTRSVHALCGIEFLPRELPLGGPALPGSPLDPGQVCPQCRTDRVPARVSGQPRQGSGDAR